MTKTFDPKEKTHFGFSEVLSSEKSDYVAKVFHSVAEKYDVMNDLMSFGLHRLWKKEAVRACRVSEHHVVLDLACGTGDLSKELVKKIKHPGLIIMADINDKMLQVGRDRLLDQGKVKQLQFIQADAEQLPFEDSTFDRIVIAFGLRNVTDKNSALHSMYRVLKPGGQLIILEFSKPVLPLLDRLYHFYSFNIIPKLGEWICKDKKSYEYLVESIRMHPDQLTLKSMMEACQFEEVNFTNLTGGIVALHKGFKY